MSKPSVFISYSHIDTEWEEKFRPHLKMLEKHSDIVFWDDRKINPGQEWYEEIKREMTKAAVSVCFISADYLASDFVYKEEIPFLLKRREKEGMAIIPVLLRDCYWESVRWLEKMQMLPGEGKSIAEDFPEKYNREFKKIVKFINQIITKSGYHIQKPAIRELSPETHEISSLSQNINKQSQQETPTYPFPKPTLKWSPPEKIDINNLPQTGNMLFGREKELGQLDEAWESKEKNVISFIAWGGVGKSTLINKWLEYMEEENYKGAERVYAWSFYSQGTSEQVSSADSFISEALKWFDDTDPTSGSAWDKGQRLAGLIRQKKTLLILDGMEPLQSSHEFERGKIKDQGLAALLRSLALNNNGLCIITSREDVVDITKYKPKAEQIDLEKLSTNAGRALLRVGGVTGTDKELETAVEAFGNHALAIKLLPVYLRSIKGHHISEALKIPDLDIPGEKGKHPRRVIEALCKRFTGKPEGDLLKMLGFFDRPAAIAAIEKIIEPPVIVGLTEHLCNKREASLLQAINTLRNENLLAKESKHWLHTPAGRNDSEGWLDCHPLIREHFGEKLENENPIAWKEAHARLYEYYKNLPEKELPDTLEEMEPLFAAVRHGCMAGKHQEALDDVFYNRIRRKDEGYNVHRLGAFGADLSCLSNFFEMLWDKPVIVLEDIWKAVTLSWAGYALPKVGRLAEAPQPMKAGLEMVIEQKNWRQSAIHANNLSELYLTLGDVATAQKYGAQSVDFADRSGDGFEMESKRTTHADALQQAGKTETAEKLFVEAEQMQEKRQPEYPYLYSLQGFQYCDLLLSKGKYKEVLERAKTNLRQIGDQYWLLGKALDKLTIGKALMAQSLANPLHPTTGGIIGRLNQAVDSLREAGTQDHLPRGLFARASLYRHQKDFFKSWAGLDEAREIAEYGQMRLHLADYHLEACRLISQQSSVGSLQSSVGSQQSSVSSQQSSIGGSQLAEFEVIENGETLRLTKEEMQAKFQEHFAEAERLVKETGYHRRDGELDELRKKSEV